MSTNRNPTGSSAIESPALGPSPLVGAFGAPRKATSPGSTAASRPQSSRAPQNATQSNNGRIRPSSSASTRVANDSTFPGPGSTLGHALSNAGLGVDKAFEGNPIPRETPGKAEPGVVGGTGGIGMDAHRREMENEAASKMPAPMNNKREDSEAKPAESVETGDLPAPHLQATNPIPKGRTSKTSTPVLPSYEPAQPRVRPTRSTNNGPSKRSHKKSNGGNMSVIAARAPSVEEEESMHEGDDEDEEGEPRYCYCNEVSFGEMVACDNDACPREWFHLSCVGLTKPPGKNGECPCKMIWLRFSYGMLTDCSQMVLQRMQGEYATEPERTVEFDRKVGV